MFRAYWNEMSGMSAEPQSRAKHKTLNQCSPTLYNAGPTLQQHWVNVSCLLESHLLADRFPRHPQDQDIHYLT